MRTAEAVLPLRSRANIHEDLQGIPYHPIQTPHQHQWKMIGKNAQTRSMISFKEFKE